MEWCGLRLRQGQNPTSFPVDIGVKCFLKTTKEAIWPLLVGVAHRRKSTDLPRETFEVTEV